MNEENKKQMMVLLQQIKEKITKVEELLGESVEDTEKWLKVLKDVEKKEGIVTKEEWITIGKKNGYDSRGLGGFFTGGKPLMVKIAGDKRAMTDTAREWLKGGEDEGA